MRKFLPLLAVLAVFSCGDPAEEGPVENPGPALVSTDPADGTGGISSFSQTILFTFDQNIACTPEGLQGISVDVDAFIEKVTPSGTVLTVVVAGLRRGKSYTVTLPAGTVHGFKQNQKPSAAVVFHFSTKEPDPGPDPARWETMTAAVKNMGAGWNLGNTLDTNSGNADDMWYEVNTDRTPVRYETGWGQPVTTRQLIHMFKEAGFNVIRVPVTWYPHIGTLKITPYQASDGSKRGIWDKDAWTGYDVDPAWMARVKEIVDYVVDEGMYCILNVHHDTGAASAAWLVASEADFAAVKDRYEALWEQIATTFKDYGEKLLFESFNEMLDPYDSWCFASFATPDRYDAEVARSAYAGIDSYNDLFVKTVRGTGGYNEVRNLVVNTYAACSGDGTWNAHLKEPLTEFHLPETPGHIAVEVHSYWEADKFAEQQADIDQLFRNLDQHLVRRLGVPVIIGEWGGGTGTDSDANVRFAGYFSQKVKDAGMAACWWMGLSDGADRAVPKWTMPRTKDAILQAYNSQNN
jgi:aryl-phospho-beta-D-glucosidase BglC (GH1 family)